LASEAARRARPAGAGEANAEKESVCLCQMRVYVSSQLIPPMINKTFLVALLGIASICRVSFGAENSSDKFLQASELFQKAKDEERTGDKAASLRDYQLTEHQLIEISTIDPSFQKSVVKYRIKQAKEGVSRLSSGDALTATAPTPNLPSTRKITYQCFFISSDNPIPHDFSKLTNRSNTDIMSAPNASGKVDQQVAVKIVKELIPEYVRGLKGTENLDSGVSIFLKGSLDHSDIILIGRTQILYVGDQSSTQESTSLATISKNIYFSKIVKNGEEAWFDVDYPEQKPKYLTIRVVPTLDPAKP